MAMCPLLREECVREQCAWWFESKSGGYEVGQQCAIALLPDQLNDVVQGLDDVQNEVGQLASYIES